MLRRRLSSSAARRVCSSREIEGCRGGVSVVVVVELLRFFCDGAWEVVVVEGEVRRAAGTRGATGNVETVGAGCIGAL